MIIELSTAVEMESLLLKASSIHAVEGKTRSDGTRYSHVVWSTPCITRSGFTTAVTETVEQIKRMLTE